jgi:hypothetical protein
MALLHCPFFNMLFVVDIQFDRNYATEMNLHNNVGYGTFEDGDFKQRQYGPPPQRLRIDTNLLGPPTSPDFTSLIYFFRAS